MPTKHGKQTVLEVTIQVNSGEEFSSFIFLNGAGQNPIQELIELSQVKPGKKIRPKYFIGFEVGIMIEKRGTYFNIVQFFHPDDYEEYQQSLE